MPGSISIESQPGIYLPLGHLFDSENGNKLLNKFFDIASIEQQMGGPEPSGGGLPPTSESAHTWNYVYNQIVVDTAVTISSIPDTAGAAQTYLSLYPIVDIPVPGPGAVTMPEVSFQSPSFETMLQTFSGIQFKYIYCYMLVSGITNTVSSPANIAIGTPASGSGLADVYLPSSDLVKESFNRDGSTQLYNRAITGASTNGFSLADLFKDEAGKQSPLRIIINNAIAVGAAEPIAVKMLFVVPLIFEVRQLVNNNDQYVIIDSKKYVEMNIGELDGLEGIDISTFGSNVTSTRFYIENLKNNVFSGLYLGFSPSGGNWLPDIIDLTEGSKQTFVDISGITQVPKIALLTPALPPIDVGTVIIPPVQRDSNGNITNRFDFMISLEAQTSINTTFNLP
jgi:hypothetical protein